MNKVAEYFDITLFYLQVFGSVFTIINSVIDVPDAVITNAQSLDQSSDWLV